MHTTLATRNLCGTWEDSLTSTKYSVPFGTQTSYWQVCNPELPWYHNTAMITKMEYDEYRAMHASWRLKSIWAGFDGCNVFRPTGYDPTWRTEGSWYHVDQNGLSKKGTNWCYQGNAVIMACEQEGAMNLMIVIWRRQIDALILIVMAMVLMWLVQGLWICCQLERAMVALWWAQALTSSSTSSSAQILVWVCKGTITITSTKPTPNQPQCNTITSQHHSTT